MQQPDHGWNEHGRSPPRRSRFGTGAMPNVVVRGTGGAPEIRFPPVAALPDWALT
ncbi:MAG: hypothetical protein AVDCRST_MAG04-889 [uncultured Acetobacteraceae bacterium]|uniref:Uncharacterized protein n=1 Tax=uncultured Acetobacteraceae bacterium TaxID=169975 RepID=A0A6J4HJ79_9PROT|nr:MAG: hypothetical protein AVDCRST_MAG04-889 [uncultured Acetobacteraceae bacterium]